jgi:hypothetical protein
MRHLKKFESKNQFEKSDINQLKSYFQDIEDEFGFGMEFDNFGTLINIRFDLTSSFFKNLKLYRDQRTGKTVSLSERYEEELCESFSNLSKFFELLEKSVRQLSNDTDFIISREHPNPNGVIIIRVGLR